MCVNNPAVRFCCSLHLLPVSPLRTPLSLCTEHTIQGANQSRTLSGAIELNQDLWQAKTLPKLNLSWGGHTRRMWSRDSAVGKHTWARLQIVFYYIRRIRFRKCKYLTSNNFEHSVNKPANFHTVFYIFLLYTIHLIGFGEHSVLGDLNSVLSVELINAYLGHNIIEKVLHYFGVNKKSTLNHHAQCVLLSTKIFLGYDYTEYTLICSVLHFLTIIWVHSHLDTSQALIIPNTIYKEQ